MKAVVLAAGKGTRLRPPTDDKPKGMVEVDGKPTLTHYLDQLVDLGADEFVIVVGYLKEKIIDHYGDEHQGVPITSSATLSDETLENVVLPRREAKTAMD